LVQVNNISKSFVNRKKKRIEAVKNVSFECRSGEIYGLLGPNGAGKTTTLRIIATLLKPDSGAVIVNGLDNQKEPDKVRAMIGFLTSDMKVSGNLTGREFLRFFGQLNHLSEEKIEERTRMLVEMLDMADFIDRSPNKLSSGMKQKLSIAISLIHDPDVIIFDEPTNGLDIFASKVVTDFLKEMKRQQKTIIISTHIMSVAEKLCDQLGLIFNGQLVENDTIENILKKHEAAEIENVFFAYANSMGVIQNA